MRKITAMAGIVLTLAACLLLSGFTTPVEYTDVYVDGVDADFEDLSFTENGTAWAPIRHVSEALGAAVKWDDSTSTVHITADGLELSVQNGASYMVANGRYLYIEDGCKTAEGRILVPVRVLCKAFGADVEWDSETASVIITSGGSPITPGNEFYNDNDLYWLSRIIHAEARGESFTGQIAVGSVVMNRVSSEEFPNTVKSVIFDRRSGIQFSPAYSGSIYNKPYESCVIAAKIALEGTDLVENSLYFSPAKAASTCWAGRNREYIGRIDNHVFFA